MYRFLFHRKYRKYFLASGYLTAEEATKNMELLTWTKDSVRELWDSVGEPGWVQYAINKCEEGCSQPVGSLDCDDFSVWAVNALQERYTPVIWIFSWISGNKLMGHAMCWCVRPNGKYIHIGNWGMSREYESLREACEDILTRYDCSTPIGWALLTKNVWPITWGLGLPNSGITNGR